MKGSVLSKPASEWLWSWSRALWDPAMELVRNPAGGYNQLGSLAGQHLIRESGWFALSALSHGDTDVARRTLAAVIRRQYDRPGSAWHGTFPVFEHDPEPGDDAVMWLSYDPNWRQFVGVTLALILDEHSHQLTDELRAACETATLRCVDGEPRGRILPSYTNPALLHAWLAWWVGSRLHHPEHIEVGCDLRDRVQARFTESKTVDEFNAPTYYGVDLVGAALWCSTEDPAWAEPGAAILAALQDELRFLYHPGLHSLCGPFTRAYGLDLRAEVTLYGLWRLLGLGLPDALPELGDVIPHGHDLFFAPLIEWAMAHSPSPFPPDDERLPRRRTFIITGGRVAEALLAQSFMLGAERGARTGINWGQYVPGTLYWLEDGELKVVWARGHEDCPVDCSIVGESTVQVVAASGATRAPRLGTNAAITPDRDANCMRIGRDVVVRGSDHLAVEYTWDGRPEIAGASATTTFFVEFSDQRR